MVTYRGIARDKCCYDVFSYEHVVQTAASGCDGLLFLVVDDAGLWLAR